MPLKKIQQLVSDDLQAVDQTILDNLQSQIELVEQLGSHIVASGGKRLRPLVVVLGVKAFGYTGDAHIYLAAAMEYFHTATLLHDDVIDESAMRRGKKTANDVWGSKASILVGDYLFTRAFQLMMHAKKVDVLQVFADASNTITRGEVLQLVHRQNPRVTEDEYFQVIHDKTAVLFAAAAKLGALLTDQSSELVEAMNRFGLHLGNAFQIVDDILDFCADEKSLGKKLGDDLSEGKMTLPLINAMKNASEKDALLITDTIANAKVENLSEILKIIERTDAIKITYEAVRREIDSAINELLKIPASPYRKALEELAQFALARQH